MYILHQMLSIIRENWQVKWIHGKNLISKMSPWACWGTGIQNNTTFLHFGSCSYDMRFNGDSWSQTFQGNSINSNEPSLQTCPIMSYPHTAASLSNIRYSKLILGKIDIKSSWLENCQITCTIVWIGQPCRVVCSRSHKAQKLSMVMQFCLRKCYTGKYGSGKA